MDTNSFIGAKLYYTTIEKYDNIVQINTDKGNLTYEFVEFCEGTPAIIIDFQDETENESDIYIEEINNYGHYLVIQTNKGKISVEAACDDEVICRICEDY